MNICSVLYLQSLDKAELSNSNLHEFLNSLEIFGRNLAGTQGQVEGHMVLANTEHSDLLDELKTPADYQITGSTAGNVSLF